MTELRTPVREELQSPVVSEAAMARMWRGVGERRGRTPMSSGMRKARPAFALAAALALAVSVFWLVSGRFGADRARLASQPGPLRLANGADITVLEARAGEPPPSPVQLSDGSVITLGSEAHLSALESTDRTFAALLSSGRVAFKVKKGGPRRWSIECGVATVEVVGTEFVVDRSPARVRVEVIEGVVLVRGERVPDRVRRLGAGEQFEIGAVTNEPAPASPPVAPITEPRPEAPATTADVPRPATAARARSADADPAAGDWRDLARKGDYRQAYDALGARGVAREGTTQSVDDLLVLADVARLSGHPADAVAPLSRIVDSGDPRAAVAAFTLGRLELDTLGQPARAAQAFTRALGLGLSASLVEDARARIVEAYARAGDRSAAQAAADVYERQFPDGRHLAAVRRWASGG